MYFLCKCALFVMMFLLGMTMFLFPKSCTKKENRNDEQAVNKIKKSGLAVSLISIIVLGTSIYLQYFL